MLQFGTLPKELTEKNLHLFSEEVIPKVRHLGVDMETLWPDKPPGRLSRQNGQVEIFRVFRFPKNSTAGI